VGNATRCRSRGRYQRCLKPLGQIKAALAPLPRGVIIASAVWFPPFSNPAFCINLAASIWYGETLCTFGQHSDALHRRSTVHWIGESPTNTTFLLLVICCHIN
jgi:hypothetical protein